MNGYGSELFGKLLYSGELLLLDKHPMNILEGRTPRVRPPAVLTKS